MTSIPLLLALMVGLSNAGMMRPFPIYQPQVNLTSSVSGPPLKTVSALTTIAPLNPALSPQPVAQARESIASDASMLQPAAVNPSTPSQNYYVYYYPHNGQTTAVGQPNSSSLWSWNGWNDVAAGVGSLALVLVGGGILYSRYGQEVKQRALRELKDVSSEDLSRMARGVFAALEKFSKLNNNME